MAEKPEPTTPGPSDGPGDVPVSEVVSQALLAGAGNCPESVTGVVSLLAGIAGEAVVADLTTAASLADRVTVLARVRTAVDAQIGRSVVAAQRADVLPHAPRTQLERQAAWSGHSASAVVTAARFGDRHPQVALLWTRGLVCTDVIAALARGLHGLEWEVEQRVVSAIIDELPRLTVRGVKLVVAQVVDLTDDDNRATREQVEYDRRRVVVTSHGGMTMIAADLPDVDGVAVMAALDAVAASLRVAGDRSTKAQRRADALITVVNRSAAHGTVPATAGGLPVAVTVTMSASEADRVATDQPRQHTTADLPDTNTDTDAETGHTGGAGGGAAGAAAVTGGGLTLGDAAARFALCTGAVTGMVVADHDCHGPDCSTGGPHRRRRLTEALVATPVHPLAVGRSTRLATTGQRTALAVRDGGCILCQRPPAECQTHHVKAWADGGTTDINNLVLLCWSHHRQVDLNRWTIHRNPDPTGGAPLWIITPVPRHQWRRRQPPEHDAA